MACAPSSLILAKHFSPLSKALALQEMSMSHGSCPKCEGKIEPFSMSLLWFPFHLRCPNCNVRLKLKSYRILLLAFIACLTVVILAISFFPFIRSYGLGVLIGVFGWFIVYNKIADNILSKNNLMPIE